MRRPGLRGGRARSRRRRPRLELTSISPLKELPRRESGSTTRRRLVIRTDGAARGNPGPAGAGWVVETPDGEMIEEGCAYLGILTNNQAEYEALIRALAVADPCPESELEIYSDSELLVRQLNGIYRVRDEALKDRFIAVAQALRRARSAEVRHVRRAENARADALANRAIDLGASSE